MAEFRVKIGFFVPLRNNQDEDDSVPKLEVFEGINVVGRNNVTVPDKRLSRKHISLNAACDGSINVTVEGSNPIVINFGDQRKKLCSRESATLVNGDIVELIPGHHFFKYVNLAGESKKNTSSSESRKRFSTGDIKPSEDETLILKRKQQIDEDEALARALQGNVLMAVLSNYMVDMDWLISACPTITKIPRVLVIHGEGDGTLYHLEKNKPANWVLHKPPLPITYGTHHSKAMFLVYPQGLRVVIHTANLIHVDWNNKSQGLWMQDFPWKDQKDLNKGCGFENDLVDYFSALKWPELSVTLPVLGSVKINSSFFKKFDYSSAAVRLIASVPGYHTGQNLKKWGHMKLRSVLQDCVFDKEFQKSPIVYQFSSLGSLDEKWMAELASSMSSGFAHDKTPLGLGKELIVWPTVEDVRCSSEGYAAGSCIPSPQKNVEKDFLKKYWAKWKANHTGRCRAMPHIKTYTRYNGQNLAWFLLTSANLSKAAWGALQKKDSQLMIRSYELGVLFLPSSPKDGCGFSCTDNGGSAEAKCGSSRNGQERRMKLVTLCSHGNKNIDSSSEIITLPVPYELPPQPYTSEDVPWSWDKRYYKKDVHGHVWPR